MCTPLQGNPKDAIASTFKRHVKGDTGQTIQQAPTKVADVTPTDTPFVATPESPTRSRRRSLIINRGRGGSGLNIPL